MAVPSIAAVMTMLERLAQRGLAGTGLLFEAFNNKARRQVIPRLDPKSIEVAYKTMLSNTNIWAHPEVTFLERLSRSLIAGSRTEHCCALM